MSDRYCPECGSPVPGPGGRTVPGAARCPHCGADVGVEATVRTGDETLVLAGGAAPAAPDTGPVTSPTEPTTVTNPAIAASPAGGAPEPDGGDALPALREALGARFEVEGVVGAGGMGRVYRARDRALGRVVALKAVTPALGASRRWVERLSVEARIIARLAHPNVVQVYEVLEAAGRPVLVLEFVDGTDVRKAIRRGALERRQAVALMAKVCRAVAYAHGKGVIHRDIKPANIMITADGEPKVMDFGIAGLSDDDGEDRGPAAGSPPFMAPEQFSGGGGDTRSDVYALGVTLYYCLCAGLPFQGPGQEELIEQIRRGRARPVREVDPTVPADLAAICARAMALEPGDRYGSAEAMALDLERALDGRPVSARDYPLLEQVRRGIARRRYVFAGACAGVALLLGGVIGSASHVHTVSEGTILAEQEDKIRNIAFTIAALVPASARTSRAGAEASRAPELARPLDSAIRRLKAFNPDIRDAYLVVPTRGGEGSDFEVVAAWHESGDGSPATGAPRGHDTWGPTPRVENADARRYLAAAAAGRIAVQHELDTDQRGVGTEWDQRLLGYAPIRDAQGRTSSVIVIEVASEAVASAFGQIEEAFRLTVAFGVLLSTGLLVLVAAGLVLLWRQEA